MRTTTLLVALLAAALAHGQTDADTKPSALGVTEGDPVPDDVRDPADEGDVLRNAVLPALAGLDYRAVVYTEKQGVCKVNGLVEIDAPRGDSYGHRHKAAVDNLVARVEAKLNAPPTQEFDQNTDTLFNEPQDWLNALRRGNAAYAFVWRDDAAAPFHVVLVRAMDSFAAVSFEFASFKDCIAERDAADAAAF